MSRWFRHYAGMMGDPKFAGVARLCKRSRAEVLFVWGVLLESASEGNSAVYEWDADVVGELLNLDTPEAQSIHDAMLAKGLLADGLIASWDRRQFVSDDSAERVKAHRQRQKDARNAVGNGDVTVRNGDVTPPETETYPEVDREAALPAATAVATVAGKSKSKGAKPKPDPPWLTDPDFCAAWDACTPQMRKRSESREKTYAHWKRQVVNTGGSSNLLHALRAYRKGDDDVKRTGGPGFHVWLSEGRWDHWTSASGTVAAIRAVWTGPPEIRNAVIRETSSDFAGSYLDTCAWTGGAIQAKTGIAADKLRRLRALQNVSILDPIGAAA